jgi:hypothetical protein
MSPRSVPVTSGGSGSGVGSTVAVADGLVGMGAAESVVVLVGDETGVSEHPVRTTATQKATIQPD